MEDKQAKWGEQSPLYAVRVLGEFPSSSDDTVCALGDVEASGAREVELDYPRVVSCDVARLGSDETVIAVRHGRRVRIARVVRGRDTMQVAGEVVRAVRATDVAGVMVVVDDVGVGGGVTDRLRELGYRVVAFNGGGRARQRDDYPNRRSEAWFTLAERLPELDLPADEQLIADLVAPRYSIDSRGRRVVEPKELTKRRLGRSPDRGDAVVMAFAVDDQAGDGRAGVGHADEPATPQGVLARRRERALARLDGSGTLGYGSTL